MYKQAPDIEAELKGKHNYSAGIGQYLLDTMKVRSGFEVAKSFRQFQSVNFPSEDEEQSCTTGKSMIATDKERSSLASLKCFLGHGDVANSEQLASLRDGIGMDFLQDTFLLHELTGGRPLAFACAQLAISLGLCRAPFTEVICFVCRLHRTSWVGCWKLRAPS